MKTVVIMRGAPGAGKTSWIAENLPGADVCSADHFYMVNGVYQFDPAKLDEAHLACMRNFLRLTEAGGSDLVAVDNTGIALQEISGYRQVARARGYHVRIVRLKVAPARAAARCVHGVPANKVESMAERLQNQNSPRAWGEEVVVL